MAADKARGAACRRTRASTTAWRWRRSRPLLRVRLRAGARARAVQRRLLLLQDRDGDRRRAASSTRRGATSSPATSATWRSRSSRDGGKTLRAAGPRQPGRLVDQRLSRRWTGDGGRRGGHGAPGVADGARRHRGRAALRDDRATASRSRSRSACRRSAARSRRIRRSRSTARPHRRRVGRGPRAACAGRAPPRDDRPRGAAELRPHRGTGEGLAVSGARRRADGIVAVWTSGPPDRSAIWCGL